jgi:hypothetical protein
MSVRSVKKEIADDRGRRNEYRVVECLKRGDNKPE